jgi:HD-like signal output (HDOD) protein
MTISNQANNPNQKALADIFSKVNMSDLPAMSDHVQELISLLNNDSVSAQELARVILKDASLTTKLLQLVNSAYFNRGVPINSISRAITTVGLNSLREMATSLALFEDFLKAGIEKDGISILLTQSFLSATQAKILCDSRKLPLSEEEVFICALLHDLGKIIILVYLPEVYRKIQSVIDKGYTDEYASQIVLKEVSFTQVGMEIARFWNFSEKVILSMARNAPRPQGKSDQHLYLFNLAIFSNRLTWSIGNELQLEFLELLLHYGPIFNLGKPEALDLVESSLLVAEEMSGPLRYGLAKLKLRTRISKFRNI